MGTLTAQQVLTLGSPGIAFIFSACFLLLAWLSPHAVYLRILAAAFCLFGLGMTSQILHVPAGLKANAVVTGALYVASAILLSAGYVRRGGMRFNGLLSFVAFAVIVGSLWYYSYVQADLIVRIWILNGGVGLILLWAAWRSRRFEQRDLVDRLLYGSFWLFAASFFMRTGLTVTSIEPGVGVSGFAQSSFWVALQLSLVLFGVLLTTLLIIAGLMDKIEVLDEERMRDPLTSLFNRRGLMAAFREEANRGDGAQIGLIALDVDHFKRINDQFGHAAGDATLQAIGTLTRQVIRKSDVVARIGGEEFAVLLRDANAAEARRVAEEIRTKISSLQIPHLPPGYQVSCSFGATASSPNQTFERLLARADALLYRAKRAGRNRVEGEHLTAEGTPLKIQVGQV